MITAKLSIMVHTWQSTVSLIDPARKYLLNLKGPFVKQLLLSIKLLEIEAIYIAPLKRHSDIDSR